MTSPQQDAALIRDAINTAGRVFYGSKELHEAGLAAVDRLLAAAVAEHTDGKEQELSEAAEPPVSKTCEPQTCASCGATMTRTDPEKPYRAANGCMGDGDCSPEDAASVIRTPYREEDGAGLTAAHTGAAVTTGERVKRSPPEVAVDGSAVAVRLAAIRERADVPTLAERDQRRRMSRESVPNTLRPPAGYQPALTARQRQARFVDGVRRATDRIGWNGRPLSPRSRAMLGQPCPSGRCSEWGYNDGCRCEGCREAHRIARLGRLHR